MSRKGVLVVGAANLDRMAYLEQLPEVGATLLADRYEEHPGGKGSNQAVAAALWEAPTWFVGRIGPDEPGAVMRQAMEHAGVRLEFLQEDPAGTGLAMDFVDQHGQYQAVVALRANACLSPEDIPQAPEFWEQIGMLVLQLESPLEAIEAAGRQAQAQGVPVLLNAAPVQSIPDSWWPWIDFLVVNETEASVLSGVSVQDAATAEQALEVLQNQARTVLLTLGAEGVLIAQGPERHALPGHAVEVVSTLGAGDAFVGVFAAEWSEHQHLLHAAQVANRAAAASVRRSGAQVSYIRRHELTGGS